MSYNNAQANNLKIFSGIDFLNKLFFLIVSLKICYIMLIEIFLKVLYFQ
jgi:hypothetical protein